MKSKERLKMSSASSLKTNIITLINILFLIPTTVFADPVVAGEIIPPASATLIADPDLIRKIAVGREGDPVWCYSSDANAIIITAPQREREKCELKTSYEIDKLKALHKLQIDTLKVELDSATKKLDDIVAIKDKEINDLTEAALKRPGDYSVWWATGGAAVGVLTTLAIMLAVK